MVMVTADKKIPLQKKGTMQVIWMNKSDSVDLDPFKPKKIREGTESDKTDDDGDDEAALETGPTLEEKRSI